MRLLPDIRYGTEGYPDKVARRLRLLNIATWMAAATHAFYAVVLLLDFSRFWWLALANMVAMLLYASVPLLHRRSASAAPIFVILVLYMDMLFYVFLIGTGIQIQFYILLGVPLTVFYLGPEHRVAAIVSAVVAAVLIIAVLLMVPHDTGLLPGWLSVASLITNTVISCTVLLLIVSYALSQAARAEQAAEREYERSERLLSNILPDAIATRLKDEGNILIADRHDEASVLFADMEGFTAHASDTAPDELVQFLNRVFSDFDRLVERHALEKIKTTGDAYMVVSGVPTARSDHAQALASLALEMREVSAKWRDARGRTVPIRIGISSGPVVAGGSGRENSFTTSGAMR
jgi:adenylate cyclase